MYSHLDIKPEDPILSIPIAFQADPRRPKVNLGVGTYRDDEGKPYILSVVRKAEEALLKEEIAKEYLPITGNPSFLSGAIEVILGKESPFLALTQTVGASGALSIGAFFLAKSLSLSTVYIPTPSWSNHTLIFEAAGYQVKTYPYYDGRLNFSALLAALEKLPNKSLLLLQAGSHNPTGADLSQEEWKELASLVRKKEHLSFFDMAYQGLADGLEDDAFPIRHFIKEKLPILFAVSFSKNLGLYGERLGVLGVTVENEAEKSRVTSHLKQLIRSTYSTPPLHGSSIASFVFSSLRTEWEEEVNRMRQRIYNTRQALNKALLYQIPSIMHQKGMFSMIGLTPLQVEALKNDWAIYLPSNGRINVAGLPLDQVDYVANALLTVLK